MVKLKQAVGHNDDDGFSLTSLLMSMMMRLLGYLFNSSM